MPAEAWLWTRQCKTIGSGEDCGKLESTRPIYRFQLLKNAYTVQAKWNTSVSWIWPMGLWFANPACANIACEATEGSQNRSKPGLRKCCWSYQLRASQGFPLHSILFSPSSISPDASVNWLLFILHAFTFQVLRKYILKVPPQHMPTKVEFHLGRRFFSQWLLLTWLSFFCLKGRK